MRERLGIYFLKPPARISSRDMEAGKGGRSRADTVTGDAPATCIGFNVSLQFALDGVDLVCATSQVELRISAA